MFFKRLSRSRSNSNSYVDDYDSSPPQNKHQAPQQQQQRSQSQQGSFDSASGAPISQQASQGNRPPSSYRQSAAQQYHEQTPQLDQQEVEKMFPSRDSAYGAARPPPASGMANGVPRMNSRDGYVDVASPVSPTKPSAMDHHVAPDMLTRAFNEALRPHTEKVEQLEQQLADLQNYVEQLEQQRMDVFAWIDKRGLRPDVPPAIAKQMDSTSDAATALNAQLDRKITIVNFDLHRLQDDLNDSISSAHFASAMAKFLPDIQRLAHLPSGSRYAYELVIKLVGNLNSHGGLEAQAGQGGAADEEIEEDRRARQAFYERMDNELVEVVTRRAQEGDEWNIQREVKRLEKNGAYLKNLGIEPYFPRALDLMRHQAEYRGGGHGTPPRYSQTQM